MDPMIMGICSASTSGMVIALNLNRGNLHFWINR